MITSRQVASFSWKDCPDSVRVTVNNILNFYRQLLGKNLTGFYLHGSLAMGCFNPGSSDIDFLAVVRRKLTIAEKKTIIDYLLSIDNGSPAAAPEMSIVTQDSLDNLVYPSSFELHYGTSWRERYLSGDFDWNTQQYDEDLIIHYLAIRRRGICLFGKAIEVIFPEITEEMCVASIARELKWISERVDTLPATYIILNPCRAIAFISEGTFMSKKEGGEWALSHFPREFSTLINQALTAYSGADEIAPPERNILRKFLDYSRREFIRLSTKHDKGNIYLRRSYS